MADTCRGCLGTSPTHSCSEYDPAAARRGASMVMRAASDRRRGKRTWGRYLTCDSYGWKLYADSCRYYLRGLLLPRPIAAAREEEREVLRELARSSDEAIARLREEVDRLTCEAMLGWVERCDQCAALESMRAGESALCEEVARLREARDEALTRIAVALERQTGQTDELIALRREEVLRAAEQYEAAARRDEEAIRLQRMALRIAPQEPGVRQCSTCRHRLTPSEQEPCRGCGVGCEAWEGLP